jgi:4,5-dihydroxyphthalate decarboxylase
MTTLTLKTVTRTQGNNRALKDGDVTGRQFEFGFVEVPVLVQAFRRMVRDLEFDVSEMAFTTYLCAKAHGKRFTALPIFPARGFHHGAIVSNPAVGASKPADLDGREVGVNRGYTVTTGVWARGILQDEHHVDLRRVTWVPSGDEHVAEYIPPDNVVPMRMGGDLVEMTASGELAAAVGTTADHADVEPLIPDAEEAGYSALRKRGLYPINHLIVVRDELLESHPDLAADLFETFAEAKRQYVDRLHRGDIAEPTVTDRMYRRVMDITDADPLPYGIDANRPMIAQLIRHAVEQRILIETPTIQGLFAAGTHDLTA